MSKRALKRDKIVLLLNLNANLSFNAQIKS